MLKHALALISLCYSLISFSQSNIGAEIEEAWRSNRIPVYNHPGDNMKHLNIFEDYHKIEKSLYNDRHYRDSMLNSMTDSLLKVAYNSGYDVIRKCVNNKCKMYYIEEIISKNKIKFTNDTLFAKPPATHLDILNEIAKYHKLKLDLKGEEGIYMKQIDAKLNLPDLQECLCIMHEGSGMCYTLKGDTLTVDKLPPNECKCDCK